jgi:adenine specific DNA methylase Mod
MNNETGVSNVGIRGNISPLSWEESTVMTDDTNDGFYTTTVKLKTANSGLEFKFVTNDKVFELVDQDNRQLRFEYAPETISYRAVFDRAESSFSSK